nr:MAG TPA: hypothetical protein [Bacteriophage sp.]
MSNGRQIQINSRFFKGLPRKVSQTLSKKAQEAKAAWDDPDSGFKTSAYGRQYQQDLDAYTKKRADYLKSRGWTEDSLSKDSGTFDTTTEGYGTDFGPRERKTAVRREVAVERAVGYGPALRSYYDKWVSAGSPSYKEATDTKADNGTQDSPAQAPDSSGSGAPVKKGYDIQGSSARSHGYTASGSGDSGEGGSGQRTGDSGDDLGTGTPSGERLKKQFKPLGK